MTGRGAGTLAAARRRVWRLWLRLRYLLLQRHRHDGLVLERVAGMPIVVLPRVFNPRLFWTGEFLARELQRQPPPEGSAVLDMGTGTGIGAITAAASAGRVVAVDVNAAAVRCARINVLLHRLEHRVEVREGDLFQAVDGEQFDLVLFNPPYYPGPSRDDLDRAFHGGDVAARFAAGLPARLRAGGAALVVLSTAGEEAEYLRRLEEAGLRGGCVAERRLVGEVLRIYRLSAGGDVADPV